MKNIKFMAWYKEKKILREVLEISFSGEYVILAGFGSFGEIEAPIRDVELMQCTGLKDKNGKEIYEGYILSVKYLYDKRTTDRVQVVWREDKAGFGLKSLKGLTNEAYELYQVTAEHNLEIIGNIYENEGLLNETKI